MFGRWLKEKTGPSVTEERESGLEESGLLLDRPGCLDTGSETSVSGRM